MEIPVSPMQAMVDAMQHEWKKARAETQMTLGDLIDDLEHLDQSRKVKGFGYLHSYRGYYSDLSFAPTDEERTVASLLEECKGAMGRLFTGWKGGDFLMGEDTPLWISSEGSCSQMRLMRLDAESHVITPVTEEEEV